MPTHSIRRSRPRLSAALILIAIILAACGGSDTDATTSSATSDSGATTSADATGSGELEPIGAADMCDLLDASDFSLAANGDIVTTPDSTDFTTTCVWSDDDGTLLNLTVTTFEAASDLDSYQATLEAADTRVPQPNFEVQATRIGDFLAVGIIDRYQVTAAFAPDDVTPSTAVRALDNWFAASS